MTSDLENKKTRENARTIKDIITPSEEIINSVELNEEESKDSATAEIKRNTSEEELIEKNKEELKEQGLEEPTEDEVRNYMNNHVHIKYKNLGKMAGLFDYSFGLGSCMVTFNMDHIFYKNCLVDIFKDNDTKVAFELFMAALVKAVDDTNLSQGDQNDNLLQTWNEKLRKYINEQQSYAK